MVFDKSILQYLSNVGEFALFLFIIFDVLKGFWQKSLINIQKTPKFV